VFLYVGASTFLVFVTHTDSFDGALIGVTFAIIIPLRFVVVFLFNTSANVLRQPSNRIPANDSFVQVCLCAKRVWLRLQRWWCLQTGLQNSEASPPSQSSVTTLLSGTGVVVV
jgi:hypothetical protein